MSKSQVRTLMCVLCLTALCALIVGCEGQATGEKAKPEVKAAPEKAKPAMAAEKPKAETAPAKAAPAAAEKGTGMGPYALAKNWMDEQGFIDHWLVAGPFPNPGTRPDENGITVDYLKNYGGELNYKPANGMEIKTDDGKMLKWQQYASPTPEINFFSIESLKLEPSQENILCYAACWVDSDADKDVELRIGSDDGYKLWVNNKLITEQNVYRSMEMDQETHKIKLNKGKNFIMIKVTQDYGEFSFEIRIVNSEGKAVPGITVWN